MATLLLIPPDPTRMASMSLHETRFYQDNLVAKAVEQLPEKERNAVILLSNSLTVTHLGGGALQEAMREVKSWLRVRFNIARGSEKRFFESQKQYDYYRTKVEQWDIALPYFREHAVMVQSAVRKTLGTTVRIYRGALLDPLTYGRYLNHLRYRGYALMPPQRFTSGASRREKAGFFGSTVAEVEIPYEGIYADSRFSALFVELFEAEVLLFTKTEVKITGLSKWTPPWPPIPLAQFLEESWE